MANKNHFPMGLIGAFSLLLFSPILLSGCKGQKEVETHWLTKPVQIDGQMTDWTGLPTTYFEDSAVQLGLCNDSDRLYILFRFSNQTWARMIRMSGLTLWLDNSGEKKKAFGVRYTGGSSFSELQNPGMAGEGGFWDRLTPEQKERLEQRAVKADQITIVGTKDKPEVALPADGSRGPAVAFADLKGIYTYEFSIPLQKSDLATYGINSQTGQAVSLGLEWGLSDEDRKRMMEEMGGRGGMGPGGGMGGGPPVGGMGGRGRGGGPGGPGGMSPPQMPKKQEIWVKTVLALPSNGQGEIDVRDL